MLTRWIVAVLLWTVVKLSTSNEIVEFPENVEIMDYIDEVLKQQQPEVLTKCDLQLLALGEGLKSPPQLWAMQMLDAWGKFPAGILSGNFFELGSYDQCRKAQHEANRSEVGLIQGRYCQLSIPLEDLLPGAGTGGSLGGRGFPSNSKALSLVFGTCFPDSCEGDHLKSLLNVTGFLNVSDIAITCEVPLPDLGAKEIAAIVIYASIATLMVLSTAYDVFTVATSRVPRPTLIMFSVYSNGIKLFKMNDRPQSSGHVKSNQIDCLNGIRVLSMVWIVFSHNYMAFISSPLNNKIAIYDWIKSYHSMFVVASTVSVDSFFLMSGMLIAWSILKELNANQQLNVPLMYLHRYLRLTPAFAALILFASTLMKYSGSGPFWNATMLSMGKACDRYWWSALLYVQNYVNPKQICLGHSWYLSVDMQLYLLSPVIVYPLWKWGRRVLIVIAGLILLTMGCVIGIFIVDQLRLAFVDVGNNPEKSRQVLTYYPTHTRAGAWLVGVIVGYVLHETRHRRIVMKKRVVFFGWVLALGVMAAIIFGDYPLQQPDTYKDHPLIVDAIYESTNRVIWAGCLGWIVFACVNGYGGPVNTFLSGPVWQPLGRLSYSVYLLHLVVQLMLTASLRNGVRFGDWEAAHKFWGDLGLTVTVAVLWTLAFESPILGLEKLLFGSLRKKPTSERSLVQEEEAPSHDSGSASTASLPAKDPV